MERIIATEASLMKKTKKELVSIILKNDVTIKELQDINEKNGQVNADLRASAKGLKEQVLKNDVEYAELLNKYGAINRLNKICVIALVVMLIVFIVTISF